MRQEASLRSGPLALTEPGPPERLKLFISYSRRDVRFVDRLVGALESRGFEVQIDRRDLPKLEDWERELLHFIQQCDTVVFIVSPASLASQVVHWEVEQVRLHGKRLAPVVIGEVDFSAIPTEISRINVIFFTDDSAFDLRADELAHALNTDVAWLKEHTRLGELARHWIERGRRGDALIRGPSPSHCWQRNREEEQCDAEAFHGRTRWYNTPLSRNTSSC